MSIRDKTRAVEDFIAWREEAGETLDINQDLDLWAKHLANEGVRAALHEIMEEIEESPGNASSSIKERVDGALDLLESTE